MPTSTRINRIPDYTPTGSRVLVQVVTPPPPTGIIMPQSYQARQTQGIVRAVGPLAKHLKPGNSVLFENLSGIEVAVNGKTYKVMREMEVLAVVETV